MPYEKLELARQVVREADAPISALRLAALAMADGDTVDRLQSHMVMQSLDAMGGDDHEV